MPWWCLDYGQDSLVQAWVTIVYDFLYFRVPVLIGSMLEVEGVKCMDWHCCTMSSNIWVRLLVTIGHNIETSCPGTNCGTGWGWDSITTSLAGQPSCNVSGISWGGVVLRTADELEPSSCTNCKKESGWDSISTPLCAGWEEGSGHSSMSLRTQHCDVLQHILVSGDWNLIISIWLVTMFGTCHSHLGANWGIWQRNWTANRGWEDLDLTVIGIHIHARGYMTQLTTQWTAFSTSHLNYCLG